MAKKEIRYGIGFDVNKQGLEEIKKELRSIQTMSEIEFTAKNPNIATDKVKNELGKIQETAKQVETALERSFNPKLDTISLQKFKQELKGIDLKTIATDFQKAGDSGKQAFYNLTTQLLTTKRELKETHSVLDKLGETLANTIRWKVASSVIDTVVNKFSAAWNYAQKLDTSLNDIRIVTGKSADEMDRFAQKANKAAKSLGATTTNYTKAALIYYQQGLGETDVQARANVTVKAANVTGQSAAEVSEQLTAVWNGYKVVAEEAELYIDKLAAVAANTAADLEELSEGMSKVASAASTMGVDIDQLSAQLSTIISVTRQDANVVGTALKTIYARMGDLEVNGVDEFGTSLGDVSGKLKQMGIDVLDQEGNLRDMGSVIEEVAAKWGTWTDAQQQAAAVAIAGKRQYNNLIALFENWDMYESALTTSKTSAGTLQKQQDIYMDSLEAHINGLTTSWEKFYDALINNESMNELIDIFSGLVDLAGTFAQSIGGAVNLLLILGPLLSKTLGKHVGSLVATRVKNVRNNIYNKQENRAEQETITDLSAAGLQLNKDDEQEKQILNDIISLKQKQLSVSKQLTEEEKQESNERILAIAKEKRALLDLKNEKEEILKEQSPTGDIKRADQNYYKDTQAQKELLEKRRKALNSLKSGDSKDDFRSYSRYHIKGLTKDSTSEEIQEKANETLKSYDEEIQRLEKILELKTDIKEVDTSSEEEIKTDISNKRDLVQKQLENNEDIVLQNNTFGSTALKKDVKVEDTKTAIKGATAENNKKIANSLKEMTKAFKDTNAISGSLKTRIQELSEDFENASDKANITIETQEKLEERYQNIIAALQEQNEEYENYLDTLDEINEKESEHEANLQKQEQEEKEAFDDAKINQFVQGISNAIGTIMNLIGVIQIFKNIGGIWENEDLTTGEKIEQTITAGISILMAMSPLIISLASKKAATDASYIAGEKAKQAANKKTEITAWKSLGPFIIIAAIVAAIIAAVAILIALFSSNKEPTALEKATKAFEKAKEEAEKTKQALSKLRDEYNNLLTDLSKYNDAKKAIDELRVGTEEWHDAVYELNLQVLDLINRYPELLSMEGAISKNEYGVYEVSQEAWDTLIQKQQQAIQDQIKVVQFADIVQSYKERDLLIETSKENISNKLDDYYAKNSASDNSNKIQTGSHVKLEKFADETYQEYIARQEKYDKSNNKKFETKIQDFSQLEEYGLKINRTSESTYYGATNDYVEIDHDALAKMTSEEISVLEAKIKNDTAISQELKTPILDAINSIKENSSQLEANTKKIDEQINGVQENIAETYGINAKVYSILDNAKPKVNIKSAEKIRDSVQLQSSNNKDHFKKLLIEAGYSEEEANNLTNRMNNEDIGETVDTKDDRASAEGYIEQLAAIAGYEVNINSDDLDEIDVKDLGGFTFKTIDGTEMSVGQLETQVAQKIHEKQQVFNSEEFIKEQQKLRDQGYSEYAALFTNGRNLGSEWNTATLREIDKVSKVNGVSGVDEFKSSFIDKAQNYLKETGFNATDNKFSLFTEQDFIDFANNIDKATEIGGGEAVKSIFENITDPKQLKKITELMDEVNWTDPKSINEFRTKLYESGIYIEENNEAWNQFMNAVNSGSKQWINNQAQVIENLKNIKNIASDIKIEDIISDEDYKKLLIIAPEIARMFIKTEEGYKALASGNELTKVLKGQYKTLDDIEKKYATINSFNEKLSYDSDLKLETSQQSQNYISRVLGIEGSDSFLTALGIEPTNLQKQLELSKSGDTQATENLQLIGKQINQAMADAESGEFSTKTARELYISSIADSWSEIVASGIDKASEEYKKGKTMWKNTYLAELGLELSQDIVESLDIYKLENAVAAVRQLELDMLVDINAKLEEANFLADTLFGEDKYNKLKESVELSKDAEEVAQIQANNAKEVFGTVLNSNLTEDEKKKYINEDGSFNYIQFLKEGLKYDENGKLDSNSQAILDSYNTLNEKTQEALEASYGIIDAQIATYEYTLEMKDKFFEMKETMREISNEFKGFVSGDLDVFGEKNAEDVIDEAFEKIPDLSLQIGNNLDKLESFKAWEERSKNIEDSTEYRAYLSAIKERDFNSKRIIELKGLIDATQLSVDSTENKFTSAVEAYNKKAESKGYVKWGYSGASLDPNSPEAKAVRAAAEERKKTKEDLAKYKSELISRQNKVNDLDLITAAKKNVISDNPYLTISDAGEIIFNEQAFSEGWEEAISKTHESLSQMKETLQELYDGYLQAQEELMGLYDKEIEKLSSMNSILSNSAELWKIVGKTSEGYNEKINTYYGSIVTNTKTSYDFAYTQLQTARMEYNKVMALGEKVSKEMIDTVTTNLAETQEKVLSSSQEWLTAIVDGFSASMGSAIDTFFEQVQGMDLAEATENWQLEMSKDERYLDEVNSAYAEESLYRQIQSSIDETDSIVAQNKLMQARLQIEKELTEAKEAQGKLTQYDLDRANAMYELTLKQIALEEAQQTANKMKLTRDAMGNYSYQYVADENAIAKAEEELAAAENNLYNIDKDRTKTLVNDYYSTWSEAQTALAEAARTGDQERVQRVYDYYFGENGLLSGMKAELGIVGDNFENMTSSWKTIVDEINNSETFNMEELFSGLNETLFDSENGAITQLNELLSSDTSPLVLATNSLTKALENPNDLADKVTLLQNKTLDVLDQLPGLTEKVGAYSNALTSLGNQYTNWIKEQGGDALTINSKYVEENTSALRELTQATLESLDQMDNDKIDGSVGDIGKWKYTGDENGWQFITENET